MVYMNSKITAVVLTHNDELRIVDCLEKLSFADELIIIDDNSNDRTIELCKNFTSKIYVRELKNNFASQRNYALNFVTGQWILFIDSDEIVSEELKSEIQEKIKSSDVAGYYIKRIDKMWGVELRHGEVGQVRLLRLAKKGNGKWHGKVHETWKIVGKTGELSSPLIHVPHQSVHEFLREIDEYSTLRAEELRENGKSVNFVSIIAFPIGKFVKNYFYNRGYKDGTPGFIYAVMMSFHSFLVRAKIFLKN